MYRKPEVVKRSFSLGIRNKSFKSTNLTFSKDKKPSFRLGHKSDSAEVRPCSREKSKIKMNGLKMLTKKYVSMQAKNGESNKENVSRFFIWKYL